MASLSDKAGFLIIANFVKYAVGFIMPMMLVRMLTKDDYGTLQQIQLVGGIAAGMLVLGLPSSVYYFYRKDDEDTRRALIQQTMWMLVGTGILATAGLVMLAPLIANWAGNPAIAVFLPIFAVSVGFTIAGDHFVHFMIAQDHYATAVLFETGETVVRVAALVVPLLSGYGLPGLIWAIVALSMARFVVRETWLLKSIGWRMAPDRSKLFAGDQLSYSMPMFLTALVGLVGGEIDRLLIATNFTPAQYAVYTVGALNIPLDTIFQAAVANVLRASLPGLVREMRYEEIARLLRESTRKLSIIVLPVFIFLFGFAHEFITLLFTKEYADSVHVFRIYLWLVPMHMLILSPIPQAFGKTKINMYLVTSVILLHVAVSFLLLKLIGYFGPAISSVTTSYVAAALYLFVAGRLLGMSPLRLLPLGALARVSAAALIALAVSYQAFGGSHQTGLLHFAMAGVLFTVVGVLAAFPLGVFTEQDRALASRWAVRLKLVRS